MSKDQGKDMSTRRFLAFCAFCCSALVACSLLPSVLRAETGSELLRDCRAETARRLHLPEKNVNVRPASEPGSAMVPGQDATLEWDAGNGAAGSCGYGGNRLVSWTVARKARQFDAEAACAAAVAKLTRKRPADVDVVEEEKTATTSTLSWVTYQGEAGKCIASEGRIRIEKD